MGAGSLMRALELWSSVISWRWTPTLGLGLGAVVYALAAIVLVPDHIGEKSRDTDADEPRRLSQHTTSVSVAHAAAPSDEATPAEPAEDAAGNRRAARRAARREREAAENKRGFSPPLPRAEPLPPEPAPQRVDVSPAQPAPEPPPAPPPPTAEAPAPVAPAAVATTNTQNAAPAPSGANNPAPAPSQEAPAPAPSAQQ
jgi:hypothetical protein